MIPVRPELEIFGTYDRGVPNLERIVLRANSPIELQHYGVLIGLDAMLGTIFPIPNHFLWLGRTKLHVPSWVFIYTGKGDPTVSQETHTKDPVHMMYWDSPYVLLDSPNIHPVLVRFADVQIGRENKSVTDLTKKVEEFDWLKLLGDVTKSPPAQK